MKVSCSGDCPFESIQMDGRSPGPVENDEIVVRSSNDPRHYSKTGKLSPSIIRASDLFNGTLSVWRASEKSGLSVAGVSIQVQADCDAQNAKEPNPKKRQSVKALHPLKVADIRAMRTEDKSSRLFCVIDECETDDNGGFHRAHAHIRLCHNVKDGLVSTEDDAFGFAKRALFMEATRVAVVHPVIDA